LDLALTTGMGNRERQPNDERHNDSLDLNHHMFLLLSDNKLFHAPLENPQSVLDVGTGTGIWAMYEPTPRPNSLGIQP
jgi:hypothetical protein